MQQRSGQLARAGNAHMPGGSVKERSWAASSIVHLIMKLTALLATLALLTVAQCGVINDFTITPASTVKSASSLAAIKFTPKTSFVGSSTAGLKITMAWDPTGKPVTTMAPATTAGAVATTTAGAVATTTAGAVATTTAGAVATTTAGAVATTTAGAVATTTAPHTTTAEAVATTTAGAVATTTVAPSPTTTARRLLQVSACVVIAPASATCELAYAAGVLTVKLTSGNFSTALGQVSMTISNFQNPMSDMTAPAVAVYENLSTGSAIDTANATFPAVTNPVTSPPATTKASASSVFVNFICVVVVLVLSMLF
jgi:hypothetical protein